YAQQIKVKGTVSGSDGEVLTGVSVSVKGTTAGTMTDVNGRFSINVSSSNAVLIFKYLGYSDKEEHVNGRENIAVVLEPENTALNEIVVIGYGTVRKSDLTGAVASIKADDLTQGTNINMQQALQGRVPGVQIY